MRKKKLNFPEGYEVYHNYQEELFVLDKVNAEAIEKESFLYRSYMNIPDDKEVECFVMDYNSKTNTYNVNLGKKIRVKMKLLASLPYGI